MNDYIQVNVGADTPDLHDYIRIALANFPVSPDNIEASYLERPNITRARFKTLTTLLNSISRHGLNSERRVDLVVFPEVSIPHSWEAMIVSWAKKHQIGVICGLEHSIDRKRKVRNVILAALPFMTASNQRACAPIRRLKRHYSPHEKFVLKEEGLKLPESKSQRYHLVNWRGASFAAYNCYELADISDRSLFVGKVDFIVCSEYNKDTAYFSNIVESAARDIHCYVVQVNDSKFGDSRVVSPSPAEKMNPLRIKGGENVAFLTIRLNLKALREHQRKGYGLQKDSQDFKPTPPGLRKDSVRKRIGRGKPV